jgi:hypothetical protein
MVFVISKRSKRLGFLRPSAAPCFWRNCFACKQSAFTFGCLGIAYPQSAVRAILLFGIFWVFFRVGFAAVGFVAEGDCVGIRVFNELKLLRKCGLACEQGGSACGGRVNDEGTTLAVHDGLRGELCEIAISILPLSISNNRLVFLLPRGTRQSKLQQNIRL